MQKIIFIGMGGFVGAVSRYLIGYLFSFVTFSFPLVTLGINFVGAFLIGAITAVATDVVPLHPNLIAFLTVGLCGGFTTFSTFSLETLQLLEKGKVLTGLFYILSSVTVCLFAVYLAKTAVRTFMA